MAPGTKRIIAGILLTALPILAILNLKQTSWGQFVATPKARQKGAAKAPLLLVEYSDFQCPMCALIQPTLHQIMTTYEGKVRMAYKYFPLTRIHPNAMASAHAAQCAAEQDKFWPYQDQLFATQLQWAPLADPTTAYLAIASKVQLDINKFSACYADPARTAPIDADHREGELRQISATPTMFVDDERLVGNVILTDGARVIEKHLRRR
jgi:protein-disulfide isomerase